MGYLRDARQFLGELRRDFFHTGAVLPSSRALGRTMTCNLRRDRPPARILEVGPGTGAVTSVILETLQPADHLDIVEINDRFVALLTERFASEEHFRRHANQAALHHCPLQELDSKERYDFIISGLPMNNFPPGMVREIFQVFRRLLKPDGMLTYFEYVLIRQLKAPFIGRDERRRLLRVGRVVGHYVNRHQVGRDLILANMPPAFVRHLRFSIPKSLSPSDMR